MGHDGTHLTHCYQGEYPITCKYGEADCPAKPDGFDAPRDNPLNLSDEEIGDLNAWLAFGDDESIKHSAVKVAQLIRRAMVNDGYL